MGGSEMESSLAIHESGCADLLKQSHWREQVTKELEKLDRRCQQACQPRGLTGRLVLRIRKRRVVGRIRRRLDPSYCLYGCR